MNASNGTKQSPLKKDSGGSSFVWVRKEDLERLSTEVMQLREFLPKVINADLIDTLQKARSQETLRAQSQKEQQRLRQECLHLRSRLDATQAECQKEREEKLLLREWLGKCREQLQQQADFCTELGAASCTLLWSASRRDDTIRDILTDGKLELFLTVAGQTLESFVKSLDEEDKPQQQKHVSHEQQFVLALAGVITNLAAVPCGRDFIASSAHVLLDTLMELIGLMKQGVFPKLKVLMLMALYNVSISIKGLIYISESPTFLPLICSQLKDQDSEVCLHALRLLQSLLMEAEVLSSLAPQLLRSLPLDRIHQLAASRLPDLGQTAQEILEDLEGLTNTQHPTTKN